MGHCLDLGSWCCLCLLMRLAWRSLADAGAIGVTQSYWHQKHSANRARQRAWLRWPGATERPGCQMLSASVVLVTNQPIGALGSQV